MRLKVAVGIATVGRAEILAETLRELHRQTRVPDRVVISCAEAQDVAGIADEELRSEFILGAAGLPRQRNRILDATADCDLLILLDDDFLPAQDYVEAVERIFRDHPDAVMVTGRVLADGICGPGLTIGEGRAILAADRRGPAPPSVTAVFNGYGCNMALRLAVGRQHRTRFDERLPLYAWQEDVDFSRRLAPYGRILRTEAARGVHLGVKHARTSGVRLGYAQIANPLYIVSKRAGYPLRHALKHIGRNLAANLVRSFKPEPWVDRRGRLLGNLLGFRDLALGRLAPEGMLGLGPASPTRSLAGSGTSGIGDARPKNAAAVAAANAELRAMEPTMFSRTPSGSSLID
jgi:GT2 family glycosyltransferase